MIDEFIGIYNKNKPKLEEKFSTHPLDYAQVVKRVISFLQEVMVEEKHQGYAIPDCDRITAIDHGEYQGVLVFVIGSRGYQPSAYWATSESYGTCSGCDTLEYIHTNWVKADEMDAVNEDQLKDYMTLCLHLLQKMVKVC